MKYLRKDRISNGMKIAISNLQKKIPVAAKKIREAILKVLQTEKIKKTGQVNLFFVSDTKIRELNLRYRGENNATDVLVFDISRARNQLLADIFISTDTAKRNARLFKSYLQYEIYLYVIHGLLHLLGYKDKGKKNRLIMRRKEAFLLKYLHINVDTQERSNSHQNL